MTAKELSTMHHPSLPSPRSLLLLLAVLLSLPAAADLLPPDLDFRPMNGLRTEELLNTVLTNPTAQKLLITNPLVTKAFDNSYMKAQLLDPAAQRFMKYLVMCALDDQQSVDWPDASFYPALKLAQGAGGPPWVGTLGVCREWAKEDWSQLDASSQQSCLERVSSCILAFNNAQGFVVPLSARSAKTETLRTAINTVPYASTLKSDADLGDPSQLVPGYKPCDAAQQPGPLSTCGWKSASVGRCTGTQVTLTVAGPACSRTKQPSFVRVCSGVRACAPAQALASSQAIACDSTQTIQFSCALGAPTFNVMVAQ